MNPFLQSTVARPEAVPCRRQPWRAQARMPGASRASLRRGAGAVTLAIGMAVAGHAAAVDVNTATAEQLDSLKGIGAKTASLIIAERTRGGPFESLQDLGERVRGLGPKRLEGLQAAGLTAGGKPAAGGKAPAGNTAPVGNRAPADNTAPAGNRAPADNRAPAAWRK